MDQKKIAELENGQFAGIQIIEITQIPDVNVLKSGEYLQGQSIEEEYRRDFGALLTEVYQTYNVLLNRDEEAEISLELLWLTEPVENQPYKAKIRIFLIFRSLCGEIETVKEELDRLLSASTTSLKLHKYGFENYPYENLETVLSNIPERAIRSIVRDEREEYLQNRMLPSCYAYDRLEAFSPDLSGMIGSLIEHPYSAVSFSIMPTKYDVTEIAALTQCTQMLDTLSKGVMAQGIGNLSFSAAEIMADTYKYYQSNRNNALFLYNVLIWSEESAAEDISSKVQSIFSYDPTVSVNLRQISLDFLNIEIAENYMALPWFASEFISQTQRSSLVNYGNKYQNFFRFPYIVTAEEASGFFRLPIGTQKVAAGLPINRSDSGRKTYGENLINAGDIEIGKLKATVKDSIGISLKDLTKHMLIVGTPGSGKTTFSVSLLDRLWKKHHVPFLVIEPAKNEYRALVQSIPDIQIFTPGKNFISPFVFNPFVPPKNVKLETYKSTLKTAFSAAVSMTTPLDKIFEETINNCYSDFKWLDTYTIDDRGEIFNICDFIKCFQKTFDEIGYTGDARNIGRAGVVRLNSLINLFDNYYSIPIQDILEKPTIIELAAIENSDEKALIISLLLLSILAYVNANYFGEDSLKNVILLEEAHVLLDAEDNAGQGEANPSAIAKNLLKRMLAEIRSYGVGIIIADQSPRKVSTDVVALTDMKMVFRLVESTDKQIIADSMNMDEAQIGRLSRLKPGEAFLFFNRLEEPEEIITPDYRLENNISITLSDENVRQLTTYWKNRREMLRPYPECSYINTCKEGCDYNRRILAKEIARRIFNKYFKVGMKDFSPLLKTFASITKIVKAELNREEFSPELFLCVKCQLWRKIRYGTDIPIKNIQIKNSLMK